MKIYIFQHSIFFIIFHFNLSQALDTCYDQQPDNSYCNQLDCQLCNVAANCKTCEFNLSSCLTCYSGQYLYQKNCSADQPNGTSCTNNNDFKECKSCNSNSNCKTCEPDSSSCLACSSGQYLYDKKCSADQPNGTSCTNNNDFKECKSCNSNSNCKTCESVNLSSCLTCSSGQYLYDKKCSADQPTGTYCTNNNDFKECKSCNSNSNCKTCEPDSSSCLTCLSGQYLYDKKCSTDQPNGTSCTNSNDIKECKSCNSSSNCKTCESVNLSSCLSCSSGQYFYDKKCSVEQPIGTFCENYICSKCNQSCKFCEKDQESCLNCLENQYFYSKKCSPTKPDGYYCDSNSYQCVNCNVINCKSCLRDQSCQECKPLYDLKSNKECVPTFKEGYYCDPISNGCLKCNNLDCSICKSDLKKCSKCKPSDFLYNEECLTSQPLGTYCDSNNECQHCTSSCSKCESDLDSCKSCQYGQYLLNKKCQSCKSTEYLLSEKCYGEYQNGTYCDSMNICSKCQDQGCKKCDKELKLCTECEKSEYLISNKCSKIILPGFTCDSNHNCKQCDIKCATCEYNSTSSCNSCNQQSNYIFQKQCYDKKPEGTFCENNNCQMCNNKNCLSCGKDLVSCQSCKSGYLYKEECVLEKPKGAFCLNGECTKCINQNCQTCEQDLNSCIECKQTDYFYLKQCYDKIPEGVVCDSQKLCSKCVDCLKCESDLTSCIKCKSSEYLFSKSCQQNPPNGATCNSNNNCDQCDSTCLTCDSDKISCTSCLTGFLFEKKCYESKQERIYCNSDKMCIKCKNKDCSDCSSSNYDKCDMCKQGFFLQEQDCVDSCSAGYQGDKDKNECIKCFTFENKCSLVQPDGTNCNNSNRICQACGVENCSKCDFDQTRCESCKQGYIADGQKCVLNSKSGCPKNQFSYNNTCVQLAPDNTNCNQQTMECKQCKSDKCFECEQDLQTCKKCNPNTFELEMNCYDKQPQNSYCENDKSSSNNIQKCYKCNQKCNECFGPGDNDCKYDDLSSILLPNTTLPYKSSFTKEDILQAYKSSEVTSTIQLQSSVALSVSKNIVSQATSGILLTGLSCQKLSYSILIKNKIPPQVFASLKATTAQIPSQQMKSLNLASLMQNSEQQEERNYLNAFFQSVNLEYNILQSCGQGITIFFICTFLYLIFFVGIEKIKQPKVNQYSKTLYDKLICSLVVQYFSLLISMFTIGINSQFLEFAYEEDIEYLGVKITLILLLLSIIILIFYKLYYYLNFQEFRVNKQSFNEITRDKIQNETIFQSKIRRNFMLIFLFSESFLIPTIFIQLNHSYIACLILAILTQICMLSIICILMPFLSKITNIYFISDSILWILFYIQYFMINYYSSQDNFDENAKTLDNLSYSIIFTLHLILIVNPLYLIVTVAQKIFEFIRQKLKKGQDRDYLMQSNNDVSVEMNSSSIISNSMIKLHSKKRK